MHNKEYQLIAVPKLSQSEIHYFSPRLTHVSI